jgi:hypothetical protein
MAIVVRCQRVLLSSRISRACYGTNCVKRQETGGTRSIAADAELARRFLATQARLMHVGRVKDRSP